MSPEGQLEAEACLIFQKGVLEVKYNLSIEKSPATFENYGNTHSYR